MRNILDLLQEYEEVWFWIDETNQERFFSELTEMKAVLVNGQGVTRESIRHCMGVSEGKVVGYVSNLVWYKTFSSPTAPVKVDYGKYADGQEDYIISEPNIQPVDVNELMEEKRMRYTADDIRNAKEVYLYDGDTLYVIDPDDEAYGYRKGYTDWFHKRNFWEYWESSLMLSFFTPITREEAVQLYLEWCSEKQGIDDTPGQNGL